MSGDLWWWKGTSSGESWGEGGGCRALGQFVLFLGEGKKDFGASRAPPMPLPI